MLRRGPGHRTRRELPMELTIVRHGIAAPRDDVSETDDAKRPLTKEGKQKTRKAARGLRAIGCSPAMIVTSPLVRAAETARIIYKEAATSASFEETQLLSPGADPSQLIDWLSSRNEPELLLVGHMPDVQILTGQLIAAKNKTGIRFKKAGAAKIRFDAGVKKGAGELQWLLEPSHLRALGNSL